MEPCCQWMREALDAKRVARLEMDGRVYFVEYNGATAKDTIRRRALNFCPWCGMALVWPVPVPGK